LVFRGQRELFTGLQLQQKYQKNMAGNLFTITGHIFWEMLLAGGKSSQVMFAL